jgi:cytochrome c biogenesis protein
VKGESRPPGGLQAISDFIESSVPQPDRARISEVLLRILNGSLFELLNATRENAGLAALKPDEKTQAFMTLSVLSLSDSFFYPAPVLFELADFKQVQASVFQVARAPGQKLVYLGAVLLIVGVFAMLYIRERRLWIWLVPAGSGTKITTAMSTTRRTLDADAEFEQLKRQVLKEAR